MNHPWREQIQWTAASKKQHISMNAQSSYLSKRVALAIYEGKRQELKAVRRTYNINQK
jgi:hypothetical protein